MKGKDNILRILMHTFSDLDTLEGNLFKYFKNESFVENFDAYLKGFFQNKVKKINEKEVNYLIKK